MQAPVAPQIIDKSIPTTGLLAQVLVAKYAERAGMTITRSTLAQWVEVVPEIRTVG